MQHAEALRWADWARIKEIATSLGREDPKSKFSMWFGTGILDMQGFEPQGFKDVHKLMSWLVGQNLVEERCFSSGYVWRVLLGKDKPGSRPKPRLDPIHELAIKLYADICGLDNADQSTLRKLEKAGYIEIDFGLAYWLGEPEEIKGG